MSQPNKQETEQLKSLMRQLARLAGTTDGLYRRMVINGRGAKYTNTARKVSVELDALVKKVSGLVGGTDERSLL